MTDINLYSLHHQTLLKSKYNTMDYTTKTPLYTPRVQSYQEPYEKVQQLNKNTGLVLNQANTQNLIYDNIICGRPETDDRSRFNYAIDQYITKAVVDVSGQAIRNNELRVQPNKYSTPAKMYSYNPTQEQSYKEYYSKTKTYKQLPSKEYNQPKSFATIPAKYF